MTELRRVLGARDVMLLTIGLVIGSGIFIVPAVVLRATGGSVLLSMLVWLLAGVLSLLGAFTYGELTAMQPEAGGLYVFLRDGFGRMVAFLYGWTLFFVISSGAVATLSVAFTGYLGPLVELGPIAAKLVSVAMIVLVTALNVKGTRDSANVQNVTTALKAGPLFILSVYLLFAGGQFAEATAAPMPALSVSLLSGVLTAMIGVLWAYEGWQYVTFLAGEIVEPQKTFPRGFAIGTGILILLYCLANGGYVAALGAERAMNSPRIAADAVTTVFGSGAGILITIPILVAMFSAANAITLTTPRVFYAMARDRVFFSRLAYVHPRFGTPAVSIIAMNVVSIVFAISGTFDQLLTYVVFTGWLFYALAAASIFVYRRNRPDAARPFRTPGYPITPVLFVLAAGVIVANALFTQPGRALVGLAIVLAGAPVYFFWRKKGDADQKEEQA
ncbi:MAG: APC family permease [Gemmatimonadota bacterium]